MTSVIAHIPASHSVATRADTALPYSEIAEQAVLSAMLCDPDVIPKVSKTLDRDAFFNAAHKRMFDAMLTLHAKDIAVDPLTIVAELERSGTLEATGGREYLAYLIEVVPSAANVEHHAKIVHRHAQRRQLIKAADTARMMAMREDAEPDEIARQLQADTLPIAVDDGEQGFRVVSRSDIDALGDAIHLRGVATSEGRIPGLATGFPEIDDVTQGFRLSEYVTIGAVPKAWKTALLHNILLNMIRSGETVGMVSAEIGRAQTLERMISADAMIPINTIGRGSLVDEEWRRFALSGNMLENRLHIDDQAYPELGDVVTRCTDLKARVPSISAIGVDYLQLITSRHRGMSTVDEINAVSRALKSLAKRLNVVVFAPFQCNFKEIDKRDDKRPQKGDVQGASGPIQDADFAILLYNDMLYNPMAAPILEANVAACRRTPPFVAKLKMYPEFQLLGSDKAQQRMRERIANQDRNRELL